jgi:hypothetical protein
MLFTDILFGVFGRLPDFYNNRFSYNNTINYETRVCIHKATLHKKIDFEADSFLRLFTDIYSGTFWRLPDSFTSRFFYNTYWRIIPLPFGAWGGGRGKEILTGTN